MKTSTETKFDRIIKEGFHEILKPVGFKKKGNNFYSFKNNIGHIINIQKSYLYSKSHIHFTINTGIFIPEYWQALYNYFNKPLPDFPTESECALRRRIGKLRNDKDTWYDVLDDTDEEEMISEMRRNVRDFILPHFGKLLSKELIIDFINSETTESEPLERLIVLGEFGNTEKAQQEFHRILSENQRNPNFLQTVYEFGKKYGLL